jgi:hypothetical protein
LLAKKLWTVFEIKSIPDLAKKKQIGKCISLKNDVLILYHFAMLYQASDIGIEQMIH